MSDPSPHPPSPAEQYAHAIALLQAGRSDAAVDWLAPLADTHPDAGVVWVNLAAACIEANRVEQAVQAAERSVELLPDDADAWTNAGLAYRLDGRSLDAAAAYERAIGCDPTHANAWLQLAACSEAVGDFDAALAILDDRFQAWVDAGQTPDDAVPIAAMLTASARMRLQRRQAVAAKRALVMAAAIDASNAETHTLLGIALRQLGRPADAVASYQTAIALDPQSAESHLNLSHAARQTGQLDVALRAAQKAEACGGDPIATGNAASSALRGQGRVEQAVEALDAVLPAVPPVRTLSNRLSLEQYRDARDADGLQQTHRQWGAAYVSRHGQPERMHFANAVAKADRGRLKIGFVSPDFGRHPVGYFLSGLLPELKAAGIDAVGYCDRGHSDDITRRLRRSLAQFTDATGLTDGELTRKIRRDRVDILVDLAGHTDGHRLELFAERAAPVQLSWMGYVGTTGVPNIDGLIADSVHVRPGEDAAYDEPIIRLPGGYVCYEPPSDLPTLRPLPPDARVLGAYHNPAKVSDATVSVWAEVLRRLPAHRLRLAYWGYDSPGTQRRLLERFARRGVASDRLEFVGARPHRAQLASYEDVALQLDPLPYSGGLTTIEAAMMGVPVVTCPGQTFASRHAARHLTTIGREAWIAGSTADYIETAVALAGDRPRLEHERTALRAAVAASPLCDYPRFAADFAAAMRSFWVERYGTASDDMLAKFCA